MEIKLWQRYNKLVIIDERLNAKSIEKILCKCDCWNIHKVNFADLKRWHIKSCWCLQKEKVLEINKTKIKHNMSKTRFYKIYRWLKNRCEYIKWKDFFRYWWRWIKCEWKTFDEFYKDMYKSYLEHLENFWEIQTTIDRINVNWNYCKKNCRWATLSEQQLNKQVHL